MKTSMRRWLASWKRAAWRTGAMNNPSSSSLCSPDYVMLPADLASDWRKKAKEFRQFGADEQAVTLEYCADDLEETSRVWQTEPLTLEEAAQETGYSYSSLQKRVSDGEIPNIGTPGQPRVRRQDLPRKAPRQRFELESGEPDLAGAILAGKL